MTTVVTKLTTDVVWAHGDLATGLQAITTLLVILFLFERELLRAFGSSRWECQAQVLNVVAVPLLVTFVAVVAGRLASLL